MGSSRYPAHPPQLLGKQWLPAKKILNATSSGCLRCGKSTKTSKLKERVGFVGYEGYAKD
jgi:hypothetical protein